MSSIGFSWLVFFVGALASTPDPLIQRAENAFDAGDYADSLKYWGEISRKNPENTNAFFRTVDLNLLVSGRAKAREIVVGLLKRPGLPEELQIIGGKKLGEINTRFLTDEGQSSYLMGLSKVRLLEYERAAQLFERAELVENLNLTVLQELARTQAVLGIWSGYVTTLKKMVAVNPFDWSRRLQLCEALIFQSQPREALEALGPGSEIPHIPNIQLARAVALFESGDFAKGRGLFLDLSQRWARAHPILWYYLGLNSKGVESAKSHRVKFLKVAARAQGREYGPDPYRTRERLVEMRRRENDLRPPAVPLKTR